MAVRQQLSLWLRGDDAGPIESLRASLDPVQHALIPAHVTLCRDEETAILTTALVQLRLAESCIRPFELRFGAPRPFDTHGWLLPCVEGEAAFQELRRCVLGGPPERVQHPHLTLAHPRNPRAARNPPGIVPEFPSGHRACVDAVYWIEQAPREAWRVVRRLPLDNGRG